MTHNVTLQWSQWDPLRYSSLTQVWHIAFLSIHWPRCDTLHWPRYGLFHYSVIIDQVRPIAWLFTDPGVTHYATLFIDPGVTHYAALYSLTQVWPTSYSLFIDSGLTPMFLSFVDTGVTQCVIFSVIGQGVFLYINLHWPRRNQLRYYPLAKVWHIALFSIYWPRCDPLGYSLLTQV